MIASCGTSFIFVRRSPSAGVSVFASFAPKISALSAAFVIGSSICPAASATLEKRFLGPGRDQRFHREAERLDGPGGALIAAREFRGELLDAARHRLRVNPEFAGDIVEPLQPVGGDAGRAAEILERRGIGDRFFRKLEIFLNPSITAPALRKPRHHAGELRARIRRKTRRILSVSRPGLSRLWRSVESTPAPFARALRISPWPRSRWRPTRASSASVSLSSPAVTPPAPPRRVDRLGRDRRLLHDAHARERSCPSS